MCVYKRYLYSKTLIIQQEVCYLFTLTFTIFYIMDDPSLYYKALQRFEDL